MFALDYAAAYAGDSGYIHTLSIGVGLVRPAAQAPVLPAVALFATD